MRIKQAKAVSVILLCAAVLLLRLSWELEKSVLLGLGVLVFGAAGWVEFKYGRCFYCEKHLPVRGIFFMTYCPYCGEPIK